ncbi:effector-associated constant component EACC1 [Streptomyces sp. NPDC003697]
MAGQVIRVRLDGSADENEVMALKAWLEREKPLEELVRSGHLHIEEQVRKDTPTGQMGSGWEIVLHVAETFTAAVALAEQTERAINAWRANRRRAGQDEPPNPQVEPPRGSDEE